MSGEANSDVHGEISKAKRYRALMDRLIGYIIRLFVSVVQESRCMDSKLVALCETILTFEKMGCFLGAFMSKDDDWGPPEI